MMSFFQGVAVTNTSLAIGEADIYKLGGILSKSLSHLFGNKTHQAQKSKKEEEKELNFEAEKLKIDTEVGKLQMAFLIDQSMETAQEFLTYLKQLKKRFLAEETELLKKHPPDDQQTYMYKMAKENLKKVVAEIRKLENFIRAKLECVSRVVITNEQIDKLMGAQHSVVDDYRKISPTAMQDDVNRNIQMIQELRQSTESREIVDTVLLSPGFRIEFMNQKIYEQLGGVGAYLVNEHTIMIPPLYSDLLTWKHEFWHAWNAINNRRLQRHLSSEAVFAAPTPFDVFDHAGFQAVMQNGVDRILIRFPDLSKKGKEGTLTDKTERAELAQYKKTAKSYQPMIHHISMDKAYINGLKHSGFVNKKLELMKQIAIEKYGMFLNLQRIVKVTDNEYIVEAVVHSSSPNKVDLLIADINFLIEHNRARYGSDNFLYSTELDAHIQQFPDRILKVFFMEREEYFSPQRWLSYRIACKAEIDKQKEVHPKKELRM